MADVLRNITEALDQLPDNTAELISPQDVREAVIAVTVDRVNATGVAGPWVVDIPAGGGWVDLASQVGPAVADEALWWAVDTNGAALPAYPPTITILGGHIRHVSLVGLIGLEAGTDPLEFTFTLAGAPIGDVVTIDGSTQVTEVLATLLHGEDMDYSDPLNRWAIAVRDPGAGARSITVTGYELRANGYPIAAVAP